MSEDLDLSRTDFHPIQAMNFHEGRVMGGEEEYGVLVREEDGEFNGEGNWIVPNNHINRQFLENGARYYKDVGHPEYSSPETRHPKDATLYDRAGELIAGEEIYYPSEDDERIGDEKISEKNKRIYKHNVDMYGNTFSSHESFCIDSNILKNKDQSIYSASLREMGSRIIPFLVSRQIIVGNGFINRNGNYEHSQRAHQIKYNYSGSTTANRGIINTKLEPLANRGKYSRLHLILGDSLMSDPSIFLRWGTMDLVLDLYEEGYLDPLELESPVEVLKTISKDTDIQLSYDFKKQKTMTAIDMQRHYWSLAEKNYGSHDEGTDELLRRWDRAISYAKEKDKELDRQLDHRIKLELLKSHMKRNGGNLGDNKTRAVELQFHDVNKKRGLFQLLEKTGHVEKFFSDEQIEYATKNPPKNTRANFRGKAKKQFPNDEYDWDEVTIEGKAYSLKDPYDPYEDLEEKVLKAA